ncbi:MAG: DUF6677 family protein [Tepidisphaeraceae bacterium]|jgi:uncharacterized protein DUF6677
MAENRSLIRSIPMVCLFAWLMPGGGYLLIGQRARGATVAVTIIALFLAGILVGGIRIMDPPGWGQFGYMSQLVEKYDRRRQQLEGEYSRVEPSSSEEEANPGSDGDKPAGPALLTEPLGELGDKPWYVGQILCGPMTLAASAVSVHVAHPPAGSQTAVEGVPQSHSRSWEIGTLYTAVAGMLNLLVIIDSAHRAGQGKQ